MKTIFINIFLLLSLSPAFSQNSLSGKIFNKETGFPLSDANIFLPDLKSSISSNDSGFYVIENIPAGKLMIEIRYTGFETYSGIVEINGPTQLDFNLTPSITEENVFVVTGVSASINIKKTPIAMVVIGKNDLLHSSSTNLVDAIASQPGISQIGTGQSISKPVIRGLGYNRVVILNDGIRQEGQQWGDEHGIEIDEYAASKIEVLKGPGSIMYGSDALAGVVNILSPEPLSIGQINGGFLANYQTNNGLTGFSGNVAGNLHGFVWLARGSLKQAHAYSNRYDGYVFNSGFKEQDLNGYIGLNKKWGYSHLHFSFYDSHLGLTEGERDSSGKFTMPFALNDSTVEDRVVSEVLLKGNELFVPYQHIQHIKLSLMNNLFIRHKKLYVNIGFEENRRQEFPDALAPDDDGLYFLLRTIPYDIRFSFPQKNNLLFTIGTNGMIQMNRNKGIEFLIPDYNLFDAGGYMTATKFNKELTISGGIRYDIRQVSLIALYLNDNGEAVSAIDSGATEKFKSASPAFSNISGAIGFSYECSDHILLKLNLARGFRSPNVAELGSNGRHEGTFRYEIGNPNLKAETSDQLDLGFAYSSPHIELEISLFANHIDHFIYLQKLQSGSGGDSLIYDEEDGSSVPVFNYVQGSALLTGGEISLDIHPHPLDWLHFKNSFSWVNSVQLHQPDSTKYLPFSPAPHFQSELRANIKKVNSVFRNAYISITGDYTFEQNHFYKAFQTETATPSYFLLNGGIGSDIFMKDKLFFSLFIVAQNITDVAYQSHLSRLKYAPENLATGRTGIFNMGRNISVKLNIPLTLKKPESNAK